jgi:hypothetical protein
LYFADPATMFAAVLAAIFNPYQPCRTRPHAGWLLPAPRTIAAGTARLFAA